MHIHTHTHKHTHTHIYKQIYMYDIYKTRGHVAVPARSSVCFPPYIHAHTHTYTHTHTHTHIYIYTNMRPMAMLRYGVATISRLLKIIGLFCKISSLL